MPRFSNCSAPSSKNTLSMKLFSSLLLSCCFLISFRFIIPLFSFGFGGGICSAPSSKKTLSMKLFSFLFSRAFLRRWYSSHSSSDSFVRGARWINVFLILLPSNSMYSASWYFFISSSSFFAISNCNFFIKDLFWAGVSASAIVSTLFGFALIAKKTWLYTMIVLFRAVFCAVIDLSFPVWASDVRHIVAQAVEAIVDCSPD